MINNNCSSSVVFNQKFPEIAIQANEKKDLNGRLPFPSPNSFLVRPPSLNEKKIEKISTEKNTFISDLNLELNSFVEAITSQNKEENADLLKDKIFSSIENMSHLFKMSLCQMLQKKQGNLQEDQVKRVLLSTFSDSDLILLQETNLQKSLRPYHQPPNTAVVLSLLSKYFDDNESKNDLMFKQLITAFNKIWFSISALSKIKSHDELILPILEEYIKDQVFRLKLNEMILLPGGWLNSSPNLEGHFMLYVLKRKSLTCFFKMRINTHKLPSSGKKATQYIMEEEIINKEQVNKIISQTLKLLFAKPLLETISKLPKNQQINHIFKIGQDYTDSAKASPYSAVVELQKDSFNCCFMAFFVLYHYLQCSVNLESNQDVNKKIEQTVAFRLTFQEYLLNQIGV